MQISDGNGGTDAITVNVTITDRTPPIITSVASGSLTSSSALITWTTDENASTKIRYGVSSSYGTTTSETDTSPRVTTHSLTLSNLHACTTYHFSVLSTDATSNTSVSSDGSFTTAGCTGNATIASSTGTTIIHNANGSTGSIMLPDRSVALSVPTGYITTNPSCATGAYFQIKSLAPSPVKSQLGAPSGRDSIIVAHALSAFCPDTTSITSFDESITITFTYTDDEISGMTETSLGAYRYGSGATAWEELVCTQDTSSNTLTCGTVAFSSFAVFGTPVASSASGEGGIVSGNGGCRGSSCRTAPRSVATSSPVAPEASPSCSAASLPQHRDRLRSTIDDQTILFNDIPVSEWYACPVFEVIQRGIFSGYRNTRGIPTGSYGPADSITLGQLAKVAVQLSRRTITGDTTGDQWATPYMNAAKALSFSAFSHRLSAASPATRGAVLQTILEALDIPTSDGPLPYSDVPQGSMYAQAIATATALGIVSGDDGDARTFRPNAPVNRAEVAKMITIALSVAR